MRDGLRAELVAQHVVDDVQALLARRGALLGQLVERLVELLDREVGLVVVVAGAQVSRVAVINVWDLGLTVAS